MERVLVVAYGVCSVVIVALTVLQRVMDRRVNAMLRELDADRRELERAVEGAVEPGAVGVELFSALGEMVGKVAVGQDALEVQVSDRAGLELVFPPVVFHVPGTAELDRADVVDSRGLVTRIDLRGYCVSGGDLTIQGLKLRPSMEPAVIGRPVAKVV